MHAVQNGVIQTCKTCEIVNQKNNGNNNNNMVILLHVHSTITNVNSPNNTCMNKRLVVVVALKWKFEHIILLGVTIRLVITADGFSLT